MKVRELRPIKEYIDDYDRLEDYIVALFRRELYFPLLREIRAPQTALKNSTSDLVSAIVRGRIFFERGTFKGKFSAETTKELRRIGARFERSTGNWKMNQSELPPEIADALSISKSRLSQTIDRLQKKLRQFLPEEIADKFQAENIFDTTLYKVDKDLAGTLKGITVTPKLTAEARAQIAKEYTENLRLYIKDFAAKEIVRLRKEVETSTVEGFRYETLVKSIQKSYGVSQNKAKFLARQETSLLMTKFKQIRYEDAGVNKYKWACVAGSANHPVRPWHKALEGKVFDWQSPPVTTKPGDPERRNNPGQDYNCRCFAIPLVTF